MAEGFRSPRQVVRRLRYLPRAARKIRNWPAFIYHYALGLTPKKPYRFRNGAQLLIGRAIDHVPIIEVFLNEEYGSVPNDSIVLDLGANIGAFSIYATTTARNVRVYSYEPFPAFGALLRENVGLNRQENAVCCFEQAVAGKSGSRPLQLTEQGFFFPTLVRTATGPAGGNEMAAECITLARIIDDNDLPRIDLLKMDCEGAEYEILYATPAVQLKKIRELRMEYHNLESPEHQLEALERFLTGHGFTITQRRENSETNGTLWMKREEAGAVSA